MNFKTWSCNHLIFKKKGVENLVGNKFQFTDFVSKVDVHCVEKAY